MTDKDPKDMTASELLRSVVAALRNGYNAETCIDKLRTAVGSEEDNAFYSEDMRNALTDLARMIDAELAQARNESLLQGAQVWAKANGWPDLRDGEDFGAWLDRCTFVKPIDDCGEPVRFGEHYGNMEQWLYSVSFCGRHAVLCGSAGEEMRVESGERVKRRVPEVLLGDGKPVSKGETAYVIESGIERTVKDFGTELCEGMDGWDGSPWVMFDNGSWMHARDLTHERPVLGADGKLIVAGETVYRLSDGERLEVLLPHGSTPETRDLVDCCGELELPSNLAHTPPDTQERIDADARKDQFEYWQCREHECDECPAEIEGMSPKKRYGCNDCCSAMTLDLLRRQRELDAKGGDA